jgi:hypothetical protein
MTTPFFLIVFEYVQPKALDRLQPGGARIKVFLGQHQSKLILELVQALQPFGKDAEYIKIQGSGPDAVDFHIAFYIGRLAASHSGASFTIVSKDRGFDPLVKHLGTLGIACQRVAEIPGAADAPAIVASAKAKPVKQVRAKKAAKKLTIIVDPPTSTSSANPTKTPTKTAKLVTPPAATAKARATKVVTWLRKSSKPATVEKLRSTIKAHITPPLDDKQIAAVIQSLKDSKKIAVVGTKVTNAL